MKKIKKLLVATLAIGLLSGCNTAGINVDLLNIFEQQSFSKQERQEFEAYQKELVEYLDELGGLLNEINSLTERYSVTRSGEHLMKIMIATAGLEVAVDQEKNINVPEFLEDAHSKMRLGLKDLKYVSQNYSVALHNDDVNSYYVCLEKIDNASRLFERGLNEVNEFAKNL